MATIKPKINECDKLVFNTLKEHSCQTFQQIRGCMNRLYGETYAVGSISASLRKMVSIGYAAYSNNEKGQKVYWLTDLGKECSKDYEIKGE